MELAACSSLLFQVPNTEQPFACVDLMYLATLLDTLGGLGKGAVVKSAANIGGGPEGQNGGRGFTGGWTLAAAFHVYENGL